MVDPLGNVVILRQGRSGAGPGAFGSLHGLFDHNVDDFVIERVVSNSYPLTAPLGRFRYVAELRPVSPRLHDRACERQPGEQVFRVGQRLPVRLSFGGTVMVMDTAHVARLARLLWAAYGDAALDNTVTEPTVVENADGS